MLPAIEEATISSHRRRDDEDKRPGMLPRLPMNGPADNVSRDLNLETPPPPVDPSRVQSKESSPHVPLTK